MYLVGNPVFLVPLSNILFKKCRLQLEDEILMQHYFYLTIILEHLKTFRHHRIALAVTRSRVQPHAARHVARTSHARSETNKYKTVDHQHVTHVAALAACIVRGRALVGDATFSLSRASVQAAWWRRSPLYYLLYSAFHHSLSGESFFGQILNYCKTAPQFVCSI